MHSLPPHTSQPTPTISYKLGPKPCHTQSSCHSKSKVEMCSMLDVRKLLGLTGGGRDAMVLHAQLAGGDYNQAGCKGVSCTGAFAVVNELVKDAGVGGIQMACRSKLLTPVADEEDTTTIQSSVQSFGILA